MLRSLIDLTSLIFLLLIGLCLAGLWAIHDFYRPGPLAADTTTLVVPKGSGIIPITTLLDEAGVIDHSPVFMAGVLLDRAQHLKAGEYAFPAHITKAALVEMLRSGKVVVHQLTVPEGLTSAQISALLNAETALSGPPLNQIPPEGSLLPETYNYDYQESRADLVKRMSKAMADTLNELWPAHAPDIPYQTPEQAVTLASIIEKETGKAAERPLIASVFANRLRTNMPLQSDPTVIYALTGGTGPLGRPLTHADLSTPSLYNTYLNYGLPPGPIANPGRASLEAAMHPERTRYLYFVADGTGGHAFANTLEEHNRNVESLARDLAAATRGGNGAERGASLRGFHPAAFFSHPFSVCCQYVRSCPASFSARQRMRAAVLATGSSPSNRSQASVKPSTGASMPSVRNNTLALFGFSGVSVSQIGCSAGKPSDAAPCAKKLLGR